MHLELAQEAQQLVRTRSSSPVDCSTDQRFTLNLHKDMIWFQNPNDFSWECERGHILVMTYRVIVYVVRYQLYDKVLSVCYFCVEV